MVGAYPCLARVMPSSPAPAVPPRTTIASDRARVLRSGNTKKRSVSAQKATTRTTTTIATMRDRLDLSQAIGNIMAAGRFSVDCRSLIRGGWTDDSEWFERLQANHSDLGQIGLGGVRSIPACGGSRVKQALGDRP